MENKKDLFIGSNEVVEKKNSMIERDAQCENDMVKIEEYITRDISPLVILWCTFLTLRGSNYEV